MEDDKQDEDWKVNIRTDLWNNMTVHQLNIQRELILDKISILSMMTNTQTVFDIQSALQQALIQLNGLVDNKFDSQQFKTTF
jgi:hypothetical protein